jgi:hypothetical protein
MNKKKWSNGVVESWSAGKGLTMRVVTSIRFSTILFRHYSDSPLLQHSVLPF